MSRLFENVAYQEGDTFDELKRKNEEFIKIARTEYSNYEEHRKCDQKVIDELQKELTDAKVYAGLVEKMLDKANDASSPSNEELVKQLQEQRDAEHKDFHARISEADQEITALKEKLASSTEHIKSLYEQLEDTERKWESDNHSWIGTVGCISKALALSREFDFQTCFAARFEETKASFYQEEQITKAPHKQLLEEMQSCFQFHERNLLERKKDVAFLEAQLTENDAFWSAHVEQMRRAHHAELQRQKSGVLDQVETFIGRLFEVHALHQVNVDLAAARREIEELKKSNEAILEEKKRVEDQSEMTSRLYRLEAHVRRDYEKRCTNLQREKKKLAEKVVELEAEIKSTGKEIVELTASRDRMQEKYLDALENLGVEELNDEMLSFGLEDEEDEQEEEFEKVEDEQEDEQVGGEESNDEEHKDE